VPNPLVLTSSLVASSLRGWRGSAAFRPRTCQPEQPLRAVRVRGQSLLPLVREALTELDLDALILPCPQGGSRFRHRSAGAGRQAAVSLSGRFQHRSGTVRIGRDHRLPRPGLMAAACGPAAACGAAWPSAAPSSPPAAGPICAACTVTRRGLQRRRRSRWSCTASNPALIRAGARAAVRAGATLPAAQHRQGRAWEDMGPPSLRRKLFPALPVEGRNRLRLLN